MSSQHFSQHAIPQSRRARLNGEASIKPRRVRGVSAFRVLMWACAIGVVITSPRKAWRAALDWGDLPKL